MFPLRCPYCDEVVGIRIGAKEPIEKICRPCKNQFVVLKEPWCVRCGKKLLTQGELCQDCQNKPHLFERGRALYEYGSCSSSVYRFKYAGRREYGDYFGEQMVAELGEFIRMVNPDGIIPIPLHKKRQNKRGYNQAMVLAKAVSKYSGVPVYGNFLYRKKNTRPLKSLNPIERQNNLKKAFIIGQNDVKLNTTILIDDIYTTGSTMDEVAGVLLEHGIKRIYFLVLASGDGI